MDHLPRTLLLVIVFSVCIRENESCSITFESDLSKEKFQGCTTVTILNSNMSTLSEETLLQMETVTILHIQSGTIPTCHVTPQLERMELTRCNTRNIFINPNGSYKMVYFSVEETELTELPKNLNALHKLQYLRLYNNKIERVNMAELNGLDSLKSLNLRKNRIMEISSAMEEPIHLPALERFIVNSNQLSDIDFGEWDNITEAYVCFTSDAFPALKTVGLAGNPLSCWWKDQIFNQLEYRDVEILNYEDVTCDKAPITIKDLKRMGSEYDHLRRTVNYLQRQHDRFNELVSEMNQLKVENADLKRSIEICRVEMNAFKEQTEHCEANFTLTVESRMRKAELRLRGNADALFGAWFITSTGNYPGVDLMAVGVLVINSLLLPVGRWF